LHADPGVALLTLFLVIVAIVQAGLFFVQLRLMREGMRMRKKLPLKTPPTPLKFKPKSPAVPSLNWSALGYLLRGQL
jgi:hypothetical protein